MTAFSTELNQAFHSTRYCVEYDNRWLELRIGAPVPTTLADWIRRLNGSTAAWLITAYNPGAQRADPRTNNARHRVLRDQLARVGIDWLNTVNRDDAGLWPDEPGYLIAGMEYGLALSLARRFGQAAIVGVGSRAAELIWIDRRSIAPRID